MVYDSDNLEGGAWFGKRKQVGVSTGSQAPAPAPAPPVPPKFDVKRAMQRARPDQKEAAANLPGREYQGAAVNSDELGGKYLQELSEVRRGGGGKSTRRNNTRRKNTRRKNTRRKNTRRKSTRKKSTSRKSNNKRRSTIKRKSSKRLSRRRR